MALTTQDLRAAVRRAAEAMRAGEEELNAADRVLGDGDTGQTVRRLFERIEAEADKETDSLGTYLRSAGRASVSATGSSLGTLISVSLLQTARSLADRTEMDTGEIGELLTLVEETLLSRGQVSLGDKTVADTIHAVGAALRTTEGDPARIAKQASARALDEFRDRPNKAGRARMYAAKSVGCDDPGMLALHHLIAAITTTSDATGKP